MRVTLDNLNGSSFERLVRALCLKIFGASSTVFGPGPDGGRDLTVSGVIPGYEAVSWDGYLIVQAKYRDRSVKDGTDVQWLINQLEIEKSQFLDKSTGRRVPNYYIVATNIPLSGADGKSKGSEIRTGGHKKVSDSMETWKTDLGILGYDIWPLDKISDLLLAEPDIRRTYAAWVTPGDVLSDLTDFLNFGRPDFRETLRRSLITSLRRKQFAELKDAGSVADPDIRASQVFIDVPVKSEHIGKRGKTAHVLNELVQRSREKLDPDALEIAHQQTRAKRNRVVLLGGPGQGKSTVSTMLAQIFRSVLLQSDKIAMRDDVVKVLAPEIIARSSYEGICKTIPSRYPVFVSLPAFADKVTDAREAKQKIPTLLSHIADDLFELSDIQVDREDLRAWLTAYPWTIVLDGLDEVPPSGERKAVIEAVNMLTSEVNNLSADVLFLLTTRPQGYNDDLDPNQWEHWELSDLPPERALAYARALGEARYADDPRRRDSVLKSLQQAAQAPATSRLMITPLQVTILYLIVDTGGSAPAARWTLFNEYFEVLKRREKSKGGIIQSVIEANLAHIGPIHQAVGLVLQVRSEVDGGAASRLNADEFGSLVKHYFIDLGYSIDVSQEKSDVLVSLALNRLVLLSSKEEGKIKFDVRSLQEFMAAAALTAGEMGEVEHRLEHVAGIAHWRHVWLIAASRCFSDDGFHHRRLAIIAIPRTLDEDPWDRLVQNGARLALDLFNDGLGTDHPKTRLALARHAMSALSVGPEFIEDGLDDILETGTEEIVEDALRGELVRTGTAGWRAAWALLFRLPSPDLLNRLAVEFWPDTVNGKGEVARQISRTPQGQAIDNHVRDAFGSLSPKEALDTLTRLSPMDNGTLEDIVPMPNHNVSEDRSEAPLFGSVYRGLSFLYASVDNIRLYNYLGNLGELSPKWGVMLAAQAFAANPGINGLVAALNICSGTDPQTFKGVYGYLPWPLSLALKHCSSKADFETVIEAARSGKFGDIGDWRIAEQRWASSSLQKRDFLVSFWSEGADWGLRGAPPLEHFSVTHGMALEDLLELARLANGDLPPHAANKLGYAAAFAIIGLADSEQADTASAIELFSAMLKSDKPTYASAFGSVSPEAWSDERFLALATSLSARGVYMEEDVPVNAANLIASAIIRKSSYKGLICALVSVCLSADLDKVETALVEPRYLRAIENLAFDSKKERIYHSIFLAMFGINSMPAARLGDLIAEEWSNDNLLRRLVLDFFDASLADEAYRRDAIYAFLKHKWHDKLLDEAGMKRSFRGILDRRRSGLTQRSNWTGKMNLPVHFFDAVIQPSLQTAPVN